MHFYGAPNSFRLLYHTPCAVECVFINKEINNIFGSSHLNIHVLVSVFCVFYEFRAYKLLGIVFAKQNRILILI